MILITGNKEKAQVYVPKHWASTSALTFELKSRLTNDETTWFTSDLSAYTDYFFIEIDASNLPDGEYEYRLYDNGADDEKVSSGLLRLGEYKAEKQEYNYTQEYVEYEG